MSTNKFEHKALKQIEEVNEGLLSGIAKLFIQSEFLRHTSSTPYYLCKNRLENGR